MTKKELIKNLSAHCTPKEIAKITNSSTAYVYNVLSRYNKEQFLKSNPDLSVENYIKAYNMGVMSKKELAEYFNVSRMTLNRFESRTGISKHLQDYITLRNANYNLDSIRLQLKAIHDLLQVFEKGTNLEKRIQKIIELLDNFPN